ncbi:MAG: hypothetical protein JWP08_446, partial [Bryobacterales bacterium]|nr:hypothetical protein [Bryobacterales bacterium]
MIGAFDLRNVRAIYNRNLACLTTGLSSSLQGDRCRHTLATVP